MSPSTYSTATGVLLMFAVCAFGQSKGSLAGVVRNASGVPVAGIVVVATNQVTSKERRGHSAADGRYRIQLAEGAYRVFVDGAYSAKFDKNKEYGGFAIPRGDTIENVVVTAARETVIDITVEEKEPIAPTDARLKEGAGEKTPGYSGRTSVPSESQQAADRRTMRDRWRTGFPEYDRYGDRGARGRDIPFKKGRWYDPYNQSVLKGDYPIIGNKTFMVLSGVSTTTLELRRRPTPSDVSSDQPLSAEFFGRTEALAASETLQC